ncbi:hypothetical protein Ocin01_19415 [Orchesella cincta]|uniref:Uncharacterized protein n=1 Tax=Orchesella cincta TaxID=48709 RepID=A0A1D2M2S3_ORCCI|nr:hypothetical protein Ocin01_19415 [Orchesella cincta]
MTEKRFKEIVGFITKPFGPEFSDPVTYYEKLWQCWNDLYVVFDLGCRLNLGRAKRAIKLTTNCFPTYLELMERRLT